MRSNYTKLVEDSQEKYLVNQGVKLSDIKTSISTYWAVIKTCMNKIKIPAIPPLLYNNAFVTDFQKKADLFNEHFAKQCTLLNTGSTLPVFVSLTDAKILNVTFDNNDISDIISNLDSNKAHGWDGISIRMIKICGDSIIGPLSIIFKNCISKGIFPNKWKKANVVPIFKKGNKQELSNYRPISLLPIFAKIFEKIIYKNLYSHLMSNNLISTRQSGFIKGDSTINQLLSITHMINQAFDCDIPKEVRSVYLDISKAFDKVWYDGLLFKLKQNGVDDNILGLLKSPNKSSIMKLL